MKFTKEQRELIEQMFGTAIREQARFDAFLQRRKTNEERRLARKAARERVHRNKD